jgi:ribosomal protein S18 acetylase RimI-like enzyme
MDVASDYVIKNMQNDDLELAIKWAGNEGWNPGMHDAKSFYQVDPNGFFMGYLGQKPVSCISAVAYGDNFGFLGLYVVKPEFRGMGFGIKIWNRGIEYLQGRNVGLDGVPAQQENYKKYGFKLAHTNIRFAMVVKKTMMFQKDCVT